MLRPNKHQVRPKKYLTRRVSGRDRMEIKVDADDDGDGGFFEGVWWL